MMFSSIVISGIQLITKEPLTARNLSIVSVALGVGYGMGANSAILNQAPQASSADLWRFRNSSGSTCCYCIKYSSS